LPGQGGSWAIALIFISGNPQSLSPSTEGTLPGPSPDTQQALTNGRGAMRSKDLMSPDLVSEIVLLGVGTLILISLLLFIVAAFTRT
jgi:hypothetical protein